MTTLCMLVVLISFGQNVIWFMFIYLIAIKKKKRFYLLQKKNILFDIKYIDGYPGALDPDIQKLWIRISKSQISENSDTKFTDPTNLDLDTQIFWIFGSELW